MSAGGHEGGRESIRDRSAIDSGAQEIDGVLNLGLLKEDRHAGPLRALRDAAEAADERPVKVILETGLLNRDKKVCARQLTLDSGAHFVTTATGFGPGGATCQHVRLVHEAVGPHLGVKGRRRHPRHGDGLGYD